MFEYEGATAHTDEGLDGDVITRHNLDFEGSIQFCCKGYLLLGSSYSIIALPICLCCKHAICDFHYSKGKLSRHKENLF